MHAPFGLTFNESVRVASTKQRFLFNEGSELNKITNIYETQFRGYDASIGRFMQIDPMVDAFPDVNPYQYAFDNPILYNDPLGLLPETGIGSSGSTDIAICPSCPNDPKFDQYRNDPNRVFEYDPKSGSVTEIPVLDEVVVEGSNESNNRSKTYYLTGYEVGDRVMKPRDGVPFLNRFADPRVFNGFIVDDMGLLTDQVAPTTGVAPDISPVSKSIKLAKDAKGVWRWISNGRKASKQTLQRYGLEKPKTIAKRGKATQPTSVEQTVSGVPNNPGPKTFWGKVKDIIAILGQAGG